MDIAFNIAFSSSISISLVTTLTYSYYQLHTHWFVVILASTPMVRIIFVLRMFVSTMDSTKHQAYVSSI